MSVDKEKFPPNGRMRKKRSIISHGERGGGVDDYGQSGVTSRQLKGKWQSSFAHGGSERFASMSQKTASGLCDALRRIGMLAVRAAPRGGRDALHCASTLHDGASTTEVLVIPMHCQSWSHRPGSIEYIVRRECGR